MNRVSLLFAEPFGALCVLAGILACADSTGIASDRSPSVNLSCSIPRSQLLNGGPGKDGIPALTNPTFVPDRHEEAGYLLASDRVVGIVLDSQPLAIPLNIFWWHEIVNLDRGTQVVAVTHCPLTGSTLAFHRSGVGGAEFGVSGLLYQNNLVMYDRRDPESLWPQMIRGARCGAADGTDLTMVPVVEMTWEGWRTLHPSTLVVSANTGYSRNYQSYPYGDYDDLQNASLLFPGSVDNRRPPKERVLGIPHGTGGLAFPFGLLDESGARAAVHAENAGDPLVVFWGPEWDYAMAYSARLDGQTLTFSVSQGQIRDDQTGSTWRPDGVAVLGPLAGKALDPVPEAFVAFWFAWPTFYSDVEIWRPQ